ncbi:S41 family peptidase [candidate division WOR-3 bacterium]|nr:S41 family peptidase [candidate division WOR-3 bacterium]
MNRKKHILLILLVIFSISGFVYSSINVFTALKTIDQVLRLIRDSYVNPMEIDKLLDYAIEAITDSLDVHTTYLKESDYENLMIQTKGEFGGLGIQIYKRGDYITIISPIENTPAYRIGLLQGDKITVIEGISTKDMKLNKAVSMMRGKPGTKITITISREGVDEPIDFTITRAIIKIKSVPYAGMIEKDVGYIRLGTFSQTSTSEMRNAIDSLINQGAENLILDLRSNPGGVLQEAYEIASLFIEKGKEIVYTEGKIVYDSYKSNNGSYKNIPLVVLVDGGSASGSEIVAGAIQDWDRGFLLGTKTFGKGSVQRVYPLPNKKALKLTIARYHTPSGRCIDRELVEDTITVYITKGELHREVKGGGGIIPDSILLYEYTDLYRKIVSQSLNFNFIVRWTHEHPDINSVTPGMIEDYKELVKEKGVEFSKTEWDSSLVYIKRSLKIGLADNKFGVKGRYRAMIPEDKQIQTAVNILKNAKTPSDVFVNK